MEKALLNLQPWCDLNKLTVNKKKTKVMLVPRSEVAKTNWGLINISLKGKELGKVGV